MSEDAADIEKLEAAHGWPEWKRLEQVTAERDEARHLLNKERQETARLHALMVQLRRLVEEVEAERDAALKLSTLPLTDEEIAYGERLVAEGRHLAPSKPLKIRQEDSPPSC